MATSKQVRRKIEPRTKVGLWLTIGPSATLLLIVLLYTFATWALTASNLIGSNTLTVTIQILLIVVGIVVAVAWLPALIVGIVLLAVKK